MPDANNTPRPLTHDEVEKLRALLVERAKHMNEDDLRALLGRESRAEKKLSALGASLPGLVTHVRLGFGMVKDYITGAYRKLPWWSVASVAAGLGYFLTPTDLLPDFIPVLGYLDDAAVLAAVMAGVREDLRKYAEAKGISLE